MPKHLEANRSLNYPLLFRMLAGVFSCMHGYQFQAVFILTCALSACGSRPPRGTPPPNLYATTSYWMNPYWQAEMLTAMQSVVRLPANASSSATPRIYGTLKFLFDNGAIKDPVIVTSTGDPALDKLLLQQVVTAKVPKPFGAHTDQAHEFELRLEMFTPYETFEYDLNAAIDSKKGYTRDAILKGNMGITTVDFDYLDGKALNIAVAKSSGHKDLDQISIDTISGAILPPPPPGYAGKTVHMQLIFCYDIVTSFNQPGKCPVGGNIISVEGARIKRTSVVRY
ncbi:MAG: hypothetical protein WBR15_10040 [Gammaproteobacteria bacterium]